jgi:hypothetical protein
MTYRVQPAFLLTLLLGLVQGRAPQERAYADVAPAAAAPTLTERIVYLAGNLADEDLITLTAALSASNHPGILLLDSPELRPATKQFLAAFHPERVIPVSSFSDGIPTVERQLGVKTAPAMEWKRGPPLELWKTLFPRAERVVVCPAEPRGLLLQSACLAGVVQAPLYVAHGTPDEAADLRRRLAEWHTREVLAAGSAATICRDLPKIRVVKLADENAVAVAHLRALHEKGPIQTYVLANPADTRKDLEGMSTLASWVALQKHAVLLLTDEAGENAADVVRAARKHAYVRKADTLILVAGLKAIPMERRDNPVVGGKDPYIEMEPLTPISPEPFTFATGRLFHPERGVVLLMLARQRLLAEARGPRKALVVSNPGDSLPLLETFSRNTAKEFLNAGYQTKTLFGDAVNKDDVRRALPEHDIFLWEGHYKTLVEDYGMPTWNEPLPPSLIFLQSCLALNEKEAQPLLQRGAIGIVGTPTRNYSGSGGAFTLAFFDAMLYEDRSLGASLRQAKNFLLAYSRLKEKRLGDKAKLNGANLRSAWAFTLWGDPTLKLPRTEPPAGALPPVHHEVHGKTIVISLPETPYEKVTSTKYRAQMLPNARLAGLLTAEGDTDYHRLVPFVFAEVSLPKAPADKTPRLSSRLPEKHYVFIWDAWRRCGYLLITPRAKDQTELRFHIEWEE